METSVAPSAKAATPLMQQYLSIKQRYPDEILFFRLGDFYEMFFDDAIKAAPLLEVTLTQRQSVPMCGVPHHAVTAYLSKLIKAGVSVAIAEQLEDPKATKGMVKRDVVRVMTPGTLVEDELLSAKDNNFLVSVAGLQRSKSRAAHWALAAADISTGIQWVGEKEDDTNLNTLKAQLVALNPSEILFVGSDPSVLSMLSPGRAVVRLTPVPPESTDLKNQALSAIRWHLNRDHSEAVKSLREAVPLPMDGEEAMFLDETAVRHLELVTASDPLRPGPTLFSILDSCVTAVGSRKLRWWILHPSLDLNVIETRLNQVDSLVNDSIVRDELRSLLNGISDIERISVRSQGGTSSPRDLDALRGTLRRLPEIQKTIIKIPSAFSFLLENLDVPSELLDVLETQLSEDPPTRLVDGSVIRDGFNPELDDLRGLRRNGKKWIAEMETAERQRTGIGSLKVGYNDVFGYYLEVSKTNISKVPSDWIRKQTLANGERYITPALKEQEEKILGAEEKITQLESRLYGELVHQVAAFGPTLSQIAEVLAHLDVVGALAQVAAQNNFVRPRLSDSRILNIKSGRHPVVEKQLGRDKFIPNDLTLASENQRIAIITGPNMAGKSTYLRQTALIVIMAQIGSYVPAESADIGLVDKIFTRIGASDRLSQGQSTFMVEMQEVSSLLRNSTNRSLLILDEVGRGTSTYDGVSIAWAVIEYLSDLKPRSLFATHYFELTQLEGRLAGVFNAHATAKEWPGPDGRKQVVFLYQILNGPADRSYGIHVAEMAGLPGKCVDRARAILKHLESGDHKLSQGTPTASPAQLEFFEEHPILSELRELEIDKMTPLEALNQISILKNKLTKETST